MQKRASKLLFLAMAVGWLGMAERSIAQNLRYDNRREVAIPDYATVRIGPLYSTMRFTQQAGYRWTQAEGRGTDYLSNNRRGVIRNEGSEFPLISRLDFRNYLLVTRNMDIDLSFSASYEYYPLDTQDGGFYFDMAEEGLAGQLTAEMILSRYLRGTLYDRVLYRTDFVDTRGEVDSLGGSEYEYLRNTAGMSLDWKMAENLNLGIDLSRSDLWVTSDEFKEQERVSYRESTLLEYEILPNIVLGGGVGIRQTDYRTDERPDTRQNDVYLFTRANKGAKGGFPLSEATTLEVSLGATAGYTDGQRPGEEQEQKDRTRLTATATLRTEMTRNLWHSLSYRRGLRGGFNAAFEEYDSWLYQIGYKNEMVDTTIYSDYTAADPTLAGENDYSTWRNGVKITYPLTRFIDLQASTDYTLRRNGNVDNVNNLTGELDIPENTSDYDTWTSRLGTSFSLTKTIDFVTYLQHQERISDDPDLEFTRDTFYANFVYTHQF